MRCSSCHRTDYRYVSGQSVCLPCLEARLIAPPAVRPLTSPWARKALEHTLPSKDLTGGLR